MSTTDASETETPIDPIADAPNPISTDYEVGQDNIEWSGFDIHNPVFVISSVSILAFITATLLFPAEAKEIFSSTRAWATGNFDWLLLSVANILVLFGLAVIVLPVGRIRLGGAEATPDFSRVSWFSMLFTAGMGIGLMFYGVSEPLSHYQASVAADAAAEGSYAPLLGAAGDPAEAHRLGMAATIFHWGLHPWAIYGVLALALALFSYNKGLPLTLRSAFYPLLGERVWGWPGHVIDIVAVFATLFGLATSLGLGASQATAGLNHLFGAPNTTSTQILLIIGITGVAILSVVSGVDKGVRRLSELNMTLAALLLLFVIIAGPTLAIAAGFLDNLGAYAQNILPLSAPLGREDDGFREGWTSFYWAWWMSWAPFVGIFIARVSRGRTVREFMIAVLVVPTLASVLWMTAFGGTAIDQLVQDGYQAAAEADLPLKLFAMLEALPLAGITSMIAIVLVIVFFVTSSDSGSLVIDTITAGGKLDAPIPQRVFWASFEGLAAIALLAGGGLVALQAAAVATGLPFSLVLLGLALGTAIALRDEMREEPRL